MKQRSYSEDNGIYSIMRDMVAVHRCSIRTQGIEVQYLVNAEIMYRSPVKSGTSSL